MAALNPACLHQYAIGPIVASKDFKWHVKSERNDGTVTREEAKTAIDHYLRDHKIAVQLNTDKVLAINKSLGICFKVEGSNDTYMFPALLPPKDLSVVWKKDENKKVYVGRRQVCRSQTTIFSPSTFCMFQSKVCTTLDPEARLWRDGLILSQCSTIHNLIECLVAMIDPVRSVDFVCRGGKGTEKDCGSLLDTVMSLWRDTLDSYSPGTEYQTEYLSRKHLEEHKQLKHVATYCEKKIKEAMAKEEGACAAVKQVVGDELMVESLGDLLVVPSSAARMPTTTVVVHPTAVVAAVMKHGSSQWYLFGQKLGFSHQEVNSLCHDKVTAASKLSAIIQVKTEQVGDVKKIDDLLSEICGLLPSRIDGLVKEELGLAH